MKPAHRTAVQIIGAVAAILVTLAAATVARAQFSGDDEQSRLLEVRQKQVDLRESRSRAGRAEELLRQGLVSQAELEQAQAALETAQLSYQRAVLALVDLQPRITVEEAVKYEEEDGRRFVRVRVANLTPTFDDSRLKLLSDFEGAQAIPEELRSQKVRDIFVSLLEADERASPVPGGLQSIAIALPYEVHIPELAYGARRTIRFQLLRDVDRAIVAASYRGREQRIGVQLQQGTTRQVVKVTSTQISQEADLGAQATFDLRFERAGVDVKSFQLKVLNLPPQISYGFLDAGTEARLSQFNFPAGVTQKELSLRLFLPERTDEDVVLDQPLVFWPVALGAEEALQFAEDRTYEAAEIESSRAGSLRLEIIPRGVGEIILSAPSLFSQIRSGETVESSLTVRNSGTRRLDNVRFRTEHPLNWSAAMEPEILPRLEIGSEEQVRLSIRPGPDVAVGEYEVRIRVESFAHNRPVPAEDKIYRVSVKARSSLWGSLGLIVVLGALVLTIVLVGIRVTRR